MSNPTEKAKALSAQPTPDSAATDGDALRPDFARALPSGMDDSTFQQIEDALDSAQAPMRMDDGRWLKLHERVAALSQPAGVPKPLGYTALFNAIAAATWPASEGVAINVSVAKFHESIGGNVYAAKPAADGVIPTVTKEVCNGCPHLKTEYWRDQLDNDETDSGTSARCMKADRNITSYWHERDTPPQWCPLRQPATGSRSDGEEV